MKQYDVKCPICGTVNHNLYLEETDGWMECEHCHHDVKAVEMGKSKSVPVFTPKQLIACVSLVGTRRQKRYI